MPPKSAKRGSAKKRARVSSKAAIENQQQQQQQQQEPEAVEVVMKNHEEIPVAEITVEENHEESSVPNGLAVVANNGEEVKDSIDEYEKDEHLDLEDNDPEYEPEEDGRADYDDKEIEQEEGQEVVDEMEEALEDNVGEEGDDTDDEEVEYVYEEVEGDDDDDEDDNNAGDGDNASDDEDAGEEYEHEHPTDVEEEEHHERNKVIKEKKQKEFEVFVGGLDKDATERDLRKVFSKVGVITDVRLTMNPQTKRNTGFALIRFETTEQAKNALAELKNPVINGKHCGVTQCKDSDTLYLGNICEKWKKEALKEKLKHYGVENFEDLTLVDGNNEGMNCGFAFLEFSSRSDAEEAYRRLQKRDAVFGVDKPAMVSFTDAFIDPDEEIMAQVKTVFIDLLPSSWDEDFVRGLLKKYGEIEKVELARDMPSARRNNYGFVSFATHAAAVECADSITSAGLGEGSKKAKVRARLSRPNRSRGKRIAQRDSYSGRKVGRSARPSRNRPAPQSRPAPRSRPTGALRRIGNRISPIRPSRVRDKRPALPVRPSRVRDKRPVPPVRPSRVRDKRPVTSMPVRARPATPPARSYDRRLTAAYPKSSMKRDYGRSMDLPPPRNRVSEDYGSQRRPSYRDYPANVSSYPDLHRSTPRVVPTRRDSLDDGYGQRLERPPPHLSHREGHSHDYDTLSGSKRPYTAIDDISPRYADAGARQSRPRLVDYDYVGGASQYREAYGDRLGRSSLGYSGSRSSISIQNSHGTYSSRQDTSYGRGSFGGSDGGIYSSSYAGDYISRGSDVGGSSYSSMYSSRGVNGGSSYIGGGGGSRSYY